MRRPDFSKWLVHLTRERGPPPGDDFLGDPPAASGNKVVPSLDVLIEILREGVIRGGFGYVKGKRRAVCLSEIPLASLSHFTSTPEDPKTRYRRYGVIVSKEAVYAQGGRPVIYLPDSESDWVPEDQKWRVVRFEPPHIDHTQEREWRIPDGLDLYAAGTIYLVVSTTRDAAQVGSLRLPINKQIGGIYPLEHLEELV